MQAAHRLGSLGLASQEDSRYGAHPNTINPPCVMVDVVGPWSSWRRSNAHNVRSASTDETEPAVTDPHRTSLTCALYRDRGLPCVQTVLGRCSPGAARLADSCEGLACCAPALRHQRICVAGRQLSGQARPLDQPAPPLVPPPAQGDLAGRWEASRRLHVCTAPSATPGAAGQDRHGRQAAGKISSRPGPARRRRPAIAVTGRGHRFAWPACWQQPAGRAASAARRSRSARTTARRRSAAQ